MSAKKVRHRHYGRLHAPDCRDTAYPMFARAKRGLRRKLWRCGPVTDQGMVPSCVGHAWAGWLAASPIRQQPILPDGLYDLARHYDEFDGEDYDGTSVRGAAKVLSLTGHIAEYRWAWEMSDAIKWVLSTSPVVLGVSWYEGMEEPDTGGFVHATGDVLGGHAILWCGVDLDKKTAWLRNSWGPDWGRNGTCRISLDDLGRLIGEDGECCTAVEREQG